eukprot:TRINITY_DN539_c0_g1_i2.p1 TRINITY_DN539_c0_g1~~TRINITY_DN539_c0_g1_i2.p1  ORF type:complete len:683 (+),score=299.30 TRINITY_DN539_c0_g1_i2:89-2050(+)
MAQQQVIVVGGGLSGLSAAHTILERGGRVLLLEKMSFCGGNSTKATSGMNAAPTRFQAAKGIVDNAETFFRDTANSALKGNTPELAYATQKPGAPPRQWPDPLKPENNPYLEHNKRLAYDSAPAAHWLADSFGLDLSLIAQMAGASVPRCHRGKERFPGMTITYALMEKFEKLMKEAPDRARLICKAQVNELIVKDGEVIGCKYEREGAQHSEYGPVVICTGGFGADFTDSGLLKKVRPEWMHLPTTNGVHCTGDGIKMAEAAGADTIDLDMVQVHPTALVHPNEPDAKIKFLAAEALRGQGGVLIDREGKRFVDELQKRDYVTGAMWAHNKGPYRLCLNSKAAETIKWHCAHYAGRGLMKKYDTGADLAKDMGVSPAVIEKTFADYSRAAETKSCPFGKKVFNNTPVEASDTFYVAIVTPVIHYCMGGLKVDVDARVLNKQGKVIPGLFCGGEAAGGIHGLNRLGGSSLLDCVVFGRVGGASASSCLLSRRLSAGGGGAGGPCELTVDPATKSVTISFAGGSGGAAQPARKAPAGDQKIERDTQYDFDGGAGGEQKAAAPAAAGGSGGAAQKEYTLADVAKHTTEGDCWVAVNGKVLNVTSFLNDHPGGKEAIMLYAGKDASEEFNMMHSEDYPDKYCPKCIIGKLKGPAKL